MSKKSHGLSSVAPPVPDIWADEKAIGRMALKDLQAKLEKGGHKIIEVSTDGVKVLPSKRETLISKVKDKAGGISRVPSLDEILDEINELDKWDGRKDRYNFSGIMACFRKRWYEDKGQKCDHGKVVKDCPTCRFDAGKSQPGHATEHHIRSLYAQVLNYGKPEGPILNDVRFSIPIEVTWVEEEESQKKPGKYIARNKKATVYLVGKSDSIIVGDNLQVKQFQETKSPIFQFPAKARKLTQALGTKVVPLVMAGITEPDNPEGVVAIGQVVQLAIGCKVLEMRQTPPETAVLQTVDRGNYREHIEVLVTPEEWNFLYDLAIWWVKEHHINLQFDEPPSPEYFQGWECRYCPFQGPCADRNRKTDEVRAIHPLIPGITGRIEALHGTEAPKVPDPSYEPPGAKPKKAKKGSKAYLDRMVKKEIQSQADQEALGQGD